MTQRDRPSTGVSLAADIEYRAGRPKPYRARIRWTDPATHRRRSLSEAMETSDAAESWIGLMRDMTRAGVDPAMAVKTLAEYGATIMPLAVRGLEKKTLDPYLAG